MMTNHNDTIKNQQGFIALMSAVVISVLLLAITVTLGFSTFFSRFNIVDAESKERSSSLAEACVDSAILELAKDKDYLLVSADHSIPVGSDTCNIVSLSPNTPRSFPITIQSQAIVNKAYTNLQVVIDSNLNVTSWNELPNLP